MKLQVASPLSQKVLEGLFVKEVRRMYDPLPPASRRQRVRSSVPRKRPLLFFFCQKKKFSAARAAQPVYAAA